HFALLCLDCRSGHESVAEYKAAYEHVDECERCCPRGQNGCTWTATCVHTPLSSSPVLALDQTTSASRTVLRWANHQTLVYRLANGVLYLEYHPMSSAFFSSRAPDLAFLLRPASGIVIVPHRPTARTAPQTDTQRDDICRLSRIWRPLIHEPIPSPSSRSGTLTGCISVIRRSFSTWWPGPGRSLGRV